MTHHNERGSATLELVIVMPATLLLLLGIIMAGRLALAQQAVQSVAHDAARAASIERSSSTAQQSANKVANFSLASNGLSCASTNVSVTTEGFTTTVGNNATVQAQVTCVVTLADLTAPGIPGSVTITREAVSPIDRYKER